MSFPKVLRKPEGASPPRKPVPVVLAPDAEPSGLPMPMAGGPGSQPAPFDPREAPTWQALVAEYEQEISTIGEVGAAAELYYEIGRICEEKLAQPRKAYACYSRAFQLAPKHLPNIRAARRLASQVGNFAITLHIIDSEIEAQSDPEQRAQLLMLRGRLLEEKMGKPEEAQTTYLAALEHAPDNPEVLKQIERLALQASDFETVIEIRKRMLGRIQDQKTTIELWFSLGQLYLQHLAEPAEAERAFLEVLKREPSHRGALTALQRMMVGQRRYDRLVELLLTEARQSTDPAVTSNLYYQAARIYREQQGDDERAIESLCLALALSPNDHMLLEELSELYENLMRWRELVDVLERQLKLISDRQELVSLYFKLGKIWEEKLFNEDLAIPCYRTVMELNPTYLPAAQALGKLYYRKGQWEDLVSMYEAEIRETQDGRQRGIKLYKLAEILEERMGRDEDAIKQYEASLELMPGYLPTLKALGRLYAKYNRSEALIRMYESEVRAALDEDQVIFILDKIGQLYEEKLQNIDQAILSYQRILDRSPGYLPAVRTLGKLYVRAERWEDLIRANELEAQLINDQKQVISLLHRTGEIYEEKLNDKDRAITTYKQVLGLQPSFLPALQSLGRLYFLKGQWVELIAMFRQEIDVTKNEAQQVALLYKIGELYEEKLAQEESAISAYREVLAVQAGYFPALKALIRIYRNRRDWENLLEVLDREATVLEDPEQKVLSLFRVAEIWDEQLNRPDHAIETFQRILQIVPGHRPTLQALMRLHARTKNWRELLQLMARELGSETRVERQVELLFRMAEIHAIELSDQRRAAETCEQILKLQADHQPTLEMLERIYIVQRDHNALLRIWETMAARSNEPRQQLALQSQLAALKEYRLQPPQSATDNYIAMLSIDQGHHQAARSLDALYVRFGTFSGLRKLYEHLLRRTTNLDEALDLCLRLADLAEYRLGAPEVAVHYYREALRLSPEFLPGIKALKRLLSKQGDVKSQIVLLDLEGRASRDPAAAIGALMQAGRLWHTELQDYDRAAEAYSRVLSLDPLHPEAFPRLEELLVAQKNWERLALLYRDRAKVITDSRKLCELHLKLGQLLQEQLGRPRDALVALSSLLSVDPTHLEALGAVSRLSFETNQIDECIQATSQILEIAKDPALLAEAHHRLGVLFQEKQPDQDRAIRHLTKAAELASGNIDALERLRMIFTTRNQPAEAIAVLARLAELDLAHRATHLLEQARLLETGLGDTERAVQIYQRVAEIDPNNVAILQKLIELYERLERWPALVEVIEKALSKVPSDRPAEAVLLHFKLAEILAERLQNSDRAIIEYKRALERNPDHQVARERLTQLYSSSQKYYQNAVEEHRRLLQADPFRFASYHELRRIFEEQRTYDKAFCVCSVLHCLRAAEQAEEFFYGENRSKARDRSAEQLGPEEIAGLLTHPGERGEVALILQAIGPLIGKVLQADLSRHGIGKADRARPDDPFRSLADQLAQNLGGVEFDLYHSSQPTHLLAIENTSPPTIIAGDGLVKRTQVKEQRFALARALKRIRDGSYMASLFGPVRLAEIVAAVAQAFAPQHPFASLAHPDQELPKRIMKAVPRKTRKEIETIFEAQGTPLPDIAAYALSAEHSANRVGLALSNDLPNAVMHLTREAPDLDGKRFGSAAEIALALQRHAPIAELFRFAVSEEYFNIRFRLKVTILG